MIQQFLGGSLRILIVLAGLIGSVASAQDGKAVYDKACALCHGAGIAGAPRFGNAPDWAPRLARGMAALYKVAMEGSPKGMPPKGGRADLADAEVRAAVDHMAAAAKSAAPKAEPGGAGKGDAAPSARGAAPAGVPATGAAAANPGAPTLASATTGAAAAEVNAFNRLLRPLGRRNAPPAEDGIHDPAGEGTSQLQPPMTAFGGLPKSSAGNQVNWVAALDQKRIAPRWDRNDAGAAAVVMDLNIVREVKGSMPDVLYPHKQHTEWLDCSNCHPAIFVPQKGANQISMASILLGQKCGVCHGKVAFPVSECRLCHSQKKDLSATTRGTTLKTGDAR